MLAGLGHDRVIGRDDQHGQVEPRRTRQHVADESLVARHVDQGEVIAPQSERGEAQVDGDPALFFRGQPIGVDARQARTRAVLPWSMCPAVPRTRSRSPLAIATPPNSESGRLPMNSVKQLMSMRRWKRAPLRTLTG